MKALRAASELLCRKGHIYIGIENRYGFKYLMGFPDDHTGVQNITYLPRDDANELSMKKLGKPYRTYTYSYEEYKNMLESVGFTDVEFYYPFPDYKSATHILPIDAPEPLEYFYRCHYDPIAIASSHWHSQRDPGFWRTVAEMERVASSLCLLRHFASSFAIIGKKG